MLRDLKVKLYAHKRAVTYDVFINLLVQPRPSLSRAPNKTIFFASTDETILTISIILGRGRSRWLKCNYKANSPGRFLCLFHKSTLAQIAAKLK